MLVLSRQPREIVVFPDLQITVEVLEIKGDRVRLGFKAPASVTILRGELIAQPGVAAPSMAAEDLPAQAPGNRAQQRVVLLADLVG
jgi:carbon storage regulator CsrA